MLKRDVFHKQMKRLKNLVVIFSASAQVKQCIYVPQNNEGFWHIPLLLTCGTYCSNSMAKKDTISFVECYAFMLDSSFPVRCTLPTTGSE